MVLNEDAYGDSWFIPILPFSLFRLLQNLSPKSEKVYDWLLFLGKFFHLLPLIFLLGWLVHTLGTW